VLEMASRGQSQESLRIGEAFLLKNADAQGDLRRALAHLYTENGDTQSALRHLEALAGAVGAAHPGPQGPAAPDKPDLPNISAEAQGASAQVSNRASQAQAGDVSASTGR
jgi:hypothetical protein